MNSRTKDKKQPRLQPPTAFYVKGESMYGDDGVYAKAAKERGKDVFICSPLRVATTRYVAGYENFEDGCFLDLEWKAFGQVRRTAIPRKWLVKGTAKILRELQRGGFGRVPITRRQKALFIEYLMAGRPYLMSVKPEKGTTK